MNLQIFIPVFNESCQIVTNFGKLRKYLNQQAMSAHIKILNNGSTDSTLSLAKKLADRFADLSIVHFNKKGRGKALRSEILKSKADYIIYMDADLATDLSSISTMLANLHRGDDIVIGSRYDSGSKIHRDWVRLLLSKTYNKYVNSLHKNDIRDYQCGFKGFNVQRVRKICSLTRDDGWFFDTEILLLASKHQMRISSIPVIWKENKKTSVRLVPTIFNLFWKNLEFKQFHRAHK